VIGDADLAGAERRMQENDLVGDALAPKTAQKGRLDGIVVDAGAEKDSRGGADQLRSVECHGLAEYRIGRKQRFGTIDKEQRFGQAMGGCLKRWTQHGFYYSRHFMLNELSVRQKNIHIVDKPVDNFAYMWTSVDLSQSGDKLSQGIPRLVAQQTSPYKGLWSDK
jgi:hypothetical protein